MIISAVIIVLVLLVSGYLLLFNKSQMTHNAQVYNQPTTTPIATPTPTTYQVNVKDTSDSAIEQDTQATSQSLSNIDADLNNVDQSFNDQPTNLQ